MTKNALHEIKAPHLHEANYGDSIQQQFNKINENFNILANHDFIKGDKGESVISKSYSLKQNPYNNKNYSIKDAIKDAINKKYNSTEISPSPALGEVVNENISYNWYDNLNDDYLVHLLFDGEKLVSSYPFVLLDARYNNTQFADIRQLDLYIDKIDVSCVIYFDYDETNGIKANIVNVWPTIYFDKGMNDFCWYYQGTQTSIPARGPQGKDSDFATTIFIIQEAEKISNQKAQSNAMDLSPYKITKILASDGQIYNIEDYLKISKKSPFKYPELYPGAPCMVLNVKENSSLISSLWISIIYNDLVEKDAFLTDCGDSNNIMKKISDEYSQEIKTKRITFIDEKNPGDIQYSGTRFEFNNEIYSPGFIGSSLTLDTFGMQMGPLRIWQGDNFSNIKTDSGLILESTSSKGITLKSALTIDNSGSSVSLNVDSDVLFIGGVKSLRIGSPVLGTVQANIDNKNGGINIGKLMIQKPQIGNTKQPIVDIKDGQIKIYNSDKKSDNVNDSSMVMDVYLTNPISSKNGTLENGEELIPAQYTIYMDRLVNLLCNLSPKKSAELFPSILNKSNTSPIGTCIYSAFEYITGAPINKHLNV